MNVNELKFGTVLRSNIAFSNRKDNKDAKKRYFVFLGRDSILCNPVFIFLSSPTTKGKDEEKLKKLLREHPKTCIDFTPKNSNFPCHCVFNYKGGFSKCQ